MKINTDPQKIKELLSRGVERIIEKKSLESKLKSGKRLRVKHGVDPTGPKIHLGRAFQFWKLRSFQELGHKIVLIFGDFTAQIGDASDKFAMRKPLTEKEVKDNLKDYSKQIGRILDMSKVELRYNSEWLNKLSAKDLISLSMKFTSQQMIQRRNFKERWEKKKPIGLHELSYPLLQGYDSVMVKADIETGGSDQLFNLEVGREIQKEFSQKPQDILTTKMLIGLDGRKMSTSWKNIITIIDSPEDIYGKIMSMRDSLIPEYFELCTRLSQKEIKDVLKDKKIPIRDLKSYLAKEVAGLYHDQRAAAEAEKNFERVFKKKGLPSKIPTVKVKEKSVSLLDLLVKAKLAASKAEAKRLILQRGVKVDGKLQDNWQKDVQIKKGTILQAGKRRFAKVI